MHLRLLTFVRNELLSQQLCVPVDKEVELREDGEPDVTWLDHESPVVVISLDGRIQDPRSGVRGQESPPQTKIDDVLCDELYHLPRQIPKVNRLSHPQSMHLRLLTFVRNEPLSQQLCVPVDKEVELREDGEPDVTWLDHESLIVVISLDDSV
ncbi:hypothetical protein FIBSPDRAFT_1048674 [Athelia psychrophila]|uniref:Uncharacterized protein n=1 Tax=Athelia psychrophila TaxID=1759441 RepID=A0A166DGN0_9AGAM|nr:hypothetical protein FIBSPDRAFT_1048674 [Fibularhizoctonia sp. CBS 109695]